MVLGFRQYGLNRVVASNAGGIDGRVLPGAHGKIYVRFFKEAVEIGGRYEELLKAVNRQCSGDLNVYLQGLISNSHGSLSASCFAIDVSYISATS